MGARTEPKRYHQEKTETRFIHIARREKKKTKTKELAAGAKKGALKRTWDVEE